MESDQKQIERDTRHENLSAVGQVIAQLRRDAGLTQADIAASLKYSAAKVSRLEAGEIDVGADEISQVLAAIDTPQAREFGDYLAHPWTELPQPPFEHPNRPDLRRAEMVLRRISELLSEPDLKNAFVEQVKLYEAEIRRASDFLMAVHHNLAFIGTIGVGKTTAICSLADLRLSAEPSLDGRVNLAQQMALEVGGGGTTICEVRIVAGPRLGIIVEPQSDEAIRLDVADFCEYLVRTVQDQTAEATGDDVGTSPETERAIRNMANLQVVSKKLDSGKRQRTDPAKELARSVSDSKRLAIEVLTRMNLPRRHARTAWCPDDVPSKLKWLQKTFADINNGRSPDFPIPRLIEVVVPHSVFGCDDLDVKVIDTKGIDQSGHRADLECHFDNERTVIVLCSSFKDAPAQAIQEMLRRVKEAGASDALRRTCLLVLPMPGEALSVKDGYGATAADDQEGYAIKRDHQIDVALARLGASDVEVLFFNAMYDEFSPVRDEVLQQVRSLRARYAERLMELETTIDQLIANRDKEEVQAVLNDAIHRIQVWLNKSEDIGEISERVHSSLIAAISSTHARSIWASVRRHGSWSNLDYYYQLGFGTRTIAAKHIEAKLSDVAVIIDNMLTDDDLEPAHDFLRQMKREIDEEMTDALRRIQVAGRAEFEEDLKDDVAFWDECDAQWGRGPGYRDSIASNTRSWFTAMPHQQKETEVVQLIVEAWSGICERLRGTLERVSAPE